MSRQSPELVDNQLNDTRVQYLDRMDKKIDLSKCTMCISYVMAHWKEMDVRKQVLQTGCHAVD